MRCTKTKTQSGRIYTLYSRRTCQLSEEFSIRSPNERTLHHTWSKKSIETEWLLFCVMQFSVLGQIILYAPLNGSRVIDFQENPRVLCFNWSNVMQFVCFKRREWGKERWSDGTKERWSDGMKERRNDGATERRSDWTNERRNERAKER